MSMNIAQSQISKDEQQLSITVEDDGIGMDKAATDTSTGIGWSNIRNRVAFLKGTLDIQTAPGKGTSIFIQFNS